MHEPGNGPSRHLATMRNPVAAGAERTLATPDLGGFTREHAAAVCSLVAAASCSCTHLPHGHFPHARHARTARRANLLHNCPLRRRADQSDPPAHPASKKRDVSADRHDTWGGDAMDVAARETNVAKADGEVVWSWRPKAGAKFADALHRAGDGARKRRSFTRRIPRGLFGSISLMGGPIVVAEFVAHDSGLRLRSLNHVLSRSRQCSEFTSAYGRHS